MNLRPLLLACLVLSGCSSKEDGEVVPPPATFSDATPDTSGKKDTGATPPSDALADTTLLADASDAMMGDAPLDCIVGKTCIGSEMPSWALEDFQPKSSRYRTTYGLPVFKGKVTVVALLSGW